MRRTLLCAKLHSIGIQSGYLAEKAWSNGVSAELSDADILAIVSWIKFQVDDIHRDYMAKLETPAN